MADSASKRLLRQEPILFCSAKADSSSAEGASQEITSPIVAVCCATQMQDACKASSATCADLLGIAELTWASRSSAGRPNTRVDFLTVRSFIKIRCFKATSKAKTRVSTKPQTNEGGSESS